MKSQIQKKKKKKKNGGIVELPIPTFFQKKASHRRKVFLARFLKSFLGRLFLIGGLMIRSCQGLGVVHKWNAFSSRSNHLKIKPCDRTIKL